jgi:uncharacterized membrane protein YkoI
MAVVRRISGAAGYGGVMKKSLVVALCFALLCSFADGASARSNDRRNNDDQDLAREALKRGEVLPIARILELVAQHQPGDVIEVQLDERRGRLEYEIRILTPQGRVRELVLDARTGAFVRFED